MQVSHPLPAATAAFDFLVSSFSFLACRQVYRRFPLGKVQRAAVGV